MTRSPHTRNGIQNKVKSFPIIKIEGVMQHATWERSWDIFLFYVKIIKDLSWNSGPEML